MYTLHYWANGRQAQSEATHISRAQGIAVHMECTVSVCTEERYLGHFTKDGNWNYAKDDEVTL